MKKAQILSALALAFALGLGVVAPVANTFAADAAPLAATSGTATATTNQIQNVINTVNANATYKKMAAMIDAVNAAYTDADGEVQTSVQVKTIADAQSALVSKIQAVDTDYTKGAKETLATTVANAQKLENYSKYVTLYNAKKTAEGVVDGSIKNVTAEAAQTSLMNAIQALNSYYNKDAEGLQDAIDDVATQVTDYTNYAAVITAVEDANATLKVEKGLRDALVAAGDSASKVAEIDTIAGLISEAQAYPSAAVYGNYKTLYDKVALGQDAIDDKTNTTSTAANYSLIKDIEAAYKTATETELNITTPGDNQGTNKKVTLTSENVTVTGEFEDGVVMTVEKVERKVAAFGDRKTAMYDIKLMKDGKAYNFDGSAVVTIKFEGVDGSKAGVYYVKNDNTADFMKGAEIKGDVATFTTSHFSVYAIVEDAAAGLPNTGVISAAVEGNASTTVAMVAGIATALTAAGAGVVAYRNARRSVRK